jgi:hypothetical protein
MDIVRVQDVGLSGDRTTNELLIALGLAPSIREDCKDCDSAEKVFFRKSEKNISHTDALYRTIGAWLINFLHPEFS